MFNVCEQSTARRTAAFMGWLGALLVRGVADFRPRGILYRADLVMMGMEGMNQGSLCLAGPPSLIELDNPVRSRVGTWEDFHFHKQAA